MRRHGDIIEDLMIMCENNRETEKAQIKRNIFSCVPVLCIVVTGIFLMKRKKA